MPTLNWNKWADAWSAAYPKNQMWGAIRSGENDPETGEPLYRFDDKPSVATYDAHLGDVVAAHRFVAPAEFPKDQPNEWENCFCGWAGPDHGDHLAEEVAKVEGDHNAVNEHLEHVQNATKHDKDPQTRVVGSGPGGKDPVDAIPDYSDDGEERPIRRAQDVAAAQVAAQHEKDVEAGKNAPKPAKGSAKPKAATGDNKVTVKEDEDGKREDRDDGKRPDTKTDASE